MLQQLIDDMEEKDCLAREAIRKSIEAAKAYAEASGEEVLSYTQQQAYALSDHALNIP